MTMLPDRKYLIHKAVLKSALLKSAAPADDNDCYMQLKYDGCFTLAVMPKPGVCQLYSRTGEPVLSMDHVAQQLLLQFGKRVSTTGGIVVMGEAWRKNTPHRVISGEFRRHSPSPDLTLVLFDIVPYDAFMAGEYLVPYSERYLSLVASQAGCLQPLPVASTYNPGTWGGDADATLDNLLAANPVGYDGLILREDVAWAAGDGRYGGIYKVKRIVDLDLLVVGWEEGTRANKGKIGALVCKLADGNTVSVGTGLTKADRETGPENFIGAIAQVQAMGYTETSLREPRYKGIRHDKEEPDFR